MPLGSTYGGCWFWKPLLHPHDFCQGRSTPKCRAKPDLHSETPKLCFVFCLNIRPFPLQKCRRLQIQKINTPTEASQAELSRIMSQLNDLGETETEMLAEQKTIESSISVLRTEKEDVEALITNELNPKANELKKMLRSYRGVCLVK